MRGYFKPKPVDMDSAYLSALDPELWPGHPMVEPALHPTPYTLHPTPQTLNPKPQTPNPKPYTQTPEP